MTTTTPTTLYLVVLLPWALLGACVLAAAGVYSVALLAQRLVRSMGAVTPDRAGARARVGLGAVGPADRCLIGYVPTGQALLAARREYEASRS